MRLKLFLIISLFMVPAIADIHTSNKYFIEGTTVDENVFLEGTEYINFVDIVPGSIQLSGQGAASGEEISSIFDSIAISSKRYLMGASLDISSKNLKYSKAVSVGNENEIKLDYGMDSGVQRAYAYNDLTRIDEYLSTKNNVYHASYSATPESIILKGSGSRYSFEDKDSYFYYNLFLSNAGSRAEIDAYLTASRIDDTKATPVIYKWESFAESSGMDYAKSGFDMAFIAGDRKIDAMISGLSSNGQEPKIPVNGLPWQVLPITIGNGKSGAETIEDMIRLIQMGIANSGKIEWLIEG